VQRLAVDRLEAARALLASDIREIRRAVLPLVAATYNEESVTFLKQLLAHDDQDLRVAAVGQLCKMFGSERLAEILEEYIKSGWNFYNVVTWLDRMIYGPNSNPGLLRSGVETGDTRIDRKIIRLAEGKN
jgi:hypothetical protein